MHRLVFSAIGNTMNRAALLETLTRTLGVAMVVDEQTHRAVAAAAVCHFERREDVPIKGYGEPVSVYCLAADQSQAGYGPRKPVRKCSTRRTISLHNSVPTEARSMIKW